MSTLTAGQRQIATAIKRLRALDPDGAEKLKEKWKTVGLDVTTAEAAVELAKLAQAGPTQPKQVHAPAGVQVPNQDAARAPDAQPAKSSPKSNPIKWFDALFEHQGLTTHDVVVGCYLFRRAGRSMECWPTQYAIAKACRIRRKTASRCIQQLVRFGLIESKHRRRRREGLVTSLSNVYKLLPPETWRGCALEGTLPPSEGMCS